MGPYDPIHALRDAATKIGTVAKDLAAGQAECRRPVDVANALEQLHLLVGAVTEVLRQQAAVLPEITADRDAEAAGRLIAGVADAAAEFGDKLRAAGAAVQNVR